MEEELKKIEIVFKENGYTNEMIEEIKHTDGVVDTESFISNLEDERSYWDC